MEEKVKQTLQQGEKVQWESGPESFPLLDADSRGKILLRWILTVVICGGFLALYAANNDVQSPYMFGVVIIIAICIIASPFLERRNILGEWYVITDRRALLLTRARSSFYINLNELDSLRVITGRSGRKSLVLGSGIQKNVEKQLRWLASHPRTDTQSDRPRDSAMGLVFYVPDQVDEAISLLQNYAKETRPVR